MFNPLFQKLLHGAALPLTVVAIPLPASSQVVKTAPLDRHHTPAFELLSRSLEGRSECIPFRWEASEHGEPRGAITVPVRVENVTRWFQLDTGADATTLYGTLADEAGWTKPSQRAFRPKRFSIGAVTFDRPNVTVLREMADTGIAGSLGLPLLVGRVTVIDYAERKLCFFHSADVPKEVWKGAFVGGALRDGKLFVSLRTKEFESDAIVFDTGSSAMALSVDGDAWRRMTFAASSSQKVRLLEGSAWGKLVRYKGAWSRSDFAMGDAQLGRLEVFTNSEQPKELASWTFRADGILGNAGLWDGMVVIDLSGRVDVGIIR